MASSYATDAEVTQRITSTDHSGPTRNERAGSGRSAGCGSASVRGPCRVATIAESACCFGDDGRTTFAAKSAKTVGSRSSGITTKLCGGEDGAATPHNLTAVRTNDLLSDILMKAADARKLKIGDFVRASFGCHAKNCEITAIDWPTFTLKTTDHRGDDMIRTRRYASLWFQVEPKPLSTTSPSWLVWPEGDR